MASVVHPLQVKHSKLRLPPLTATRTPTSIVLLRMCQDCCEVRQLHAQLVVSGLIDRPINAGRLVESYVSAHQICYALSVLSTIPYPEIFAYNTVIRGLTLGKCPNGSILLFDELLQGGITPDNYTYTFVLKACSHLKALSEGKQVHGQIIKAGIKAGKRPETYIHSSLIHMYSKSGSTHSAERLLAEFWEENVLAKNAMITGYQSQGHVKTATEMFDKMSIKDAASWSAMITGYTKNEMHAEALVTFQDMMASRVQPNLSVLVSALSACSQLGALDQGRLIHMNMPKKDVITWGVILSAFAMHGQAEKCFKLFDEMINDGTRPNEVLFVAILSACSHAGYVKLGQSYFNQMVHRYEIRPSIEHYGCMVDLLGRAGRLAEAEEFISSMREEPKAIIWSTLLSTCRTPEDRRTGERAFKQLMKMEPMSGDRYKQGGFLAADGGEKDANKIRKLIRDEKLETTCGWSFIKVNGVIHKFIVGNTDHSKSQEIYGILEGG
ncbi:hypothetical protein RJ639_043005 [Escallonia herrerae]|uniref:Pentatricopeptide repeat-containing protein n=1 Tax=Escallonia herrerae TaxID=1293975 RepID=A0AA88WET8_9ASTE|nr:hypothetical protein RJ639_043005 [Escallonia herrerae]